MKNKTYYLAYGSNLNMNQMKMRCPNSKPVGTMFLQNYELVFKHFLTVEKKIGATTPIGIWAITPEDEKRLDMYEGYPTHYRKEYIDIVVKGRKAKGLIYIMNNIRGITPPSGFYYDACTRGYTDFGFDKDFLLSAYLKSLNYESEE